MKYLPGEMPRWLSRTLTWGSAAAVLLVAAHFFPHLWYPKLMMALASPHGEFEAQVLVRPAAGFVTPGYITLFTGANATIVVRVTRRASGAILYEDVIVPFVEMEMEAEAVDMEWRENGSVRFNFQDRKAVRVFNPAQR